MASTDLDAQSFNAPVPYLDIQSPTRYSVAQALASSRHLYSVVNEYRAPRRHLTVTATRVASRIESRLLSLLSITGTFIPVVMLVEK